MDRCVKSVKDIAELAAVERRNGSQIVELAFNKIEIYYVGNLVGTAHVYQEFVGKNTEHVFCAICKKDAQGRIVV